MSVEILKGPMKIDGFKMTELEYSFQSTGFNILTNNSNLKLGYFKYSESLISMLNNRYCIFNHTVH